MSAGGGMIYCPSHPDAPLVDDYRAGDQICSECGLVVGDRSESNTKNLWVSVCILFGYLYSFRVVDVGSEWRNFSSEAGNADPSRVGGAENTLLNGTNLTTMIGPSTSGGGASFDESGGVVYKNRQTVKFTIKIVISKFRVLTLTD
jgi:transcription initiation factor TFIIB